MGNSGLQCGYAAIIGRPNVGKSTLLNYLLGQKIAITSRKPQTTRKVLLGVDTSGSKQVIYVDTPGIHKFDDRAINKYMVRSALSVLHDVDALIMLVDRGFWKSEDELVLSHIKEFKGSKFLAINKIDLLKEKNELLPIIDRLQDIGCFDQIFPISALNSEGLDPLRRAVMEVLPEQPHLFPPDHITDQSERFLVSEIIREKLMRNFGDEVPHRAAVVIEQYKDKGHFFDIVAEIYVERSGQKRILIGKNGEGLKRIGVEARLDIERLIGQKVMLRLWVKVKKGWTNEVSGLKRMGYD